ncbi:hypothetical protein ACN38_g6404 [Penicillium nordicum]|uniref:Uncharacterized protein n=1 Tax=Penicillium nordicum TaxID=229535 RepID=A0A0M8P859_9EURO|nr:hypothetical protein ACN38_g6404 [Penicillium nordicum]
MANCGSDKKKKTQPSTLLFSQHLHSNSSHLPSQTLTVGISQCHEHHPPTTVDTPTSRWSTLPPRSASPPPWSAAASARFGSTPMR